MTDLVKARFVCQSVLNDGYQIQAKLVPIWTGHPEDNSFSKATPGGLMELYVSNPNVHEFFKPKVVYNLALTKHEGDTYSYPDPSDTKIIANYDNVWAIHFCDTNNILALDRRAVVAMVMAALRSEGRLKDPM